MTVRDFCVERRQGEQGLARMNTIKRMFFDSFLFVFFVPFVAFFS
jgi:hypothetical protein